jgi:hypothetical protein
MLLQLFFLEEMVDLDDNSTAPSKQPTSVTDLHSEKENSRKVQRPSSKRTVVSCEVSDELVNKIFRNKTGGK